jgi:hypothetical protein
MGRLEAPPPAKSWSSATDQAGATFWTTSGHAGFVQAGESRVNAVPHRERADAIAGFLCAFALAIAGVSLVRTPGLLAPVAILVGLVAVRMTEAHRTLAAWTVGLATTAFILGMLVAISTDRPLF